jgi:hypothetical protein
MLRVEVLAEWHVLYGGVVHLGKRLHIRLIALASANRNAIGIILNCTDGRLWLISHVMGCNCGHCTSVARFDS